VDGEDWLKFHLDADARVLINAYAPSGLLVMWLNDENVEIIDYDSGGGADAPLSIKSLLSPGTCYVNLEADGWPDNWDVVTSYSISLTVTDPGLDPYEPDGTWQQASEIIPGVAQEEHAISPATDIDWVTFPLSALSYIRFTFTPASGTYDMARMYFYDANLEKIGVETRGQFLMALDPGKYHALIEAYDKTQPVADYSLNLTLSAMDGYEPDNAWDAATTLTPNAWQRDHAIRPPRDVDWYKFHLNSGVRRL